MTIRFGGSIFQKLSPLLPKDLQEDAQLIGLSQREMYLSVVTLSSELQHDLRRRGNFENAYKVQQVFSPILDVLIRLDALLHPNGRERKHTANADEYPLSQKKTSLCQSEEDMAVRQVELCALASLDQSSSTLSSSEPHSIYHPHVQQDASQWPISDQEASAHVAGLQHHAYARAALLRFKINITALSPQETVKKIELLSRQLAHTLGLCLPCLPIHLSANPQFVADLFDGIYKAGIVDVLNRLALAGSTTSRAIALQLAQQEEPGSSLAVQYAFQMGQQYAAIIRQEMQATGIDISHLVQEIRFCPYDFVSILCAR